MASSDGNGTTSAPLGQSFKLATINYTLCSTQFYFARLSSPPLFTSLFVQSMSAARSKVSNLQLLTPKYFLVMSTQPNNPTKATAPKSKATAPKSNAAAATKAPQNLGAEVETAPRINAAAAAATFNPSAKLRRAINANNSKASKVGRQNLGVIVEASLLIHEVSQEVNRANKGTRKGQPTYVNKEAAILGLFGVSKSDLSRIYNKIANAAFETYGGKAEALMNAYENQRGAARPSVSSLLAFLKGDGGKGKAKQAPRRFAINLETGKVSAPDDITPAEVKAIVEALKALTK